MPSTETSTNFSLSGRSLPKFASEYSSASITSWGTNENSNNTKDNNEVSYGDRFIPVRTGDMISEFQRRPTTSTEEKSQKRKREEPEDNYFHQIIIQRTMFPPPNSNDDIVSHIDTCSVNSKQKFLKFHSASPKRRGIFDTPFRNVYSTTPFSRQVEDLMTKPRKPARIINPLPYQMLAFCNELMLKDDFYLNVVDWSTSNILSLGLESCAYLWNTGTSKMAKLCDLGLISSVSSVKWHPQGSQLAIGTAEGKLQIWDTQKLMKIRDCTSHSSRVGTLSWNGNLLTTGSADRCIFHRDPRSPYDNIRILTDHKSEICGLKWNNEGDQLASGGNANELFIWEGLNLSPIRKLDGHKAAVRALSWSPHSRNLLVSGGGHLDRQIRFWNTLDSRCLASYNVKSQVCNLQWSPTANEIVSTHGWWKNDVVVWQYPSMEKIATLKGHNYRVLYFSLSPNGEDIVTGAGGDDNTLRFWKVFNAPPNNKKKITKSAFKLDELIR
ncbi:WD40 repeat-like protein [Gigaspora margarita]|uniref:WD40 repeat-like protein n=1 Tax=Gigaspora margarita TaxID=4874 RepID=A0A8H3X2R8_GIGMA|nr:WD40 repeat-like protein [Gigaspora margarita]